MIINNIVDDGSGESYLPFITNYKSFCERIVLGSIGLEEKVNFFTTVKTIVVIPKNHTVEIRLPGIIYKEVDFESEGIYTFSNQSILFEMEYHKRYLVDEVILYVLKNKGSKITSLESKMFIETNNGTYEVGEVDLSKLDIVISKEDLLNQFLLRLEEIMKNDQKLGINEIKYVEEIK